MSYVAIQNGRLNVSLSKDLFHYPKFSCHLVPLQDLHTRVIQDPFASHLNSSKPTISHFHIRSYQIISDLESIEIMTIIKTIILLVIVIIIIIIISKYYYD